MLAPTYQPASTARRRLMQATRRPSPMQRQLARERRAEAARFFGTLAGIAVTTAMGFTVCTALLVQAFAPYLIAATH